MLAEKSQMGIRLLDMQSISVVLVPEAPPKKVTERTERVPFSPSALSLENLLTAIATGTTGAVQSGPDAHWAGKGPHEDFIVDRISRAVSFLQSNFKEDITLARVAMTACLSQSHFCRLFKTQIGTTFTKFLAGLRVKEAIKLLEATDLRVTDICYEAGFNDLTHFERVFKGLVGTTPSAYRHTIALKGGNRGRNSRRSREAHFPA
jgi:AraC-like DNA-binding protein